jgi:hypothetical protein
MDRTILSASITRQPNFFAPCQAALSQAFSATRREIVDQMLATVYYL